MRLRTAVTVILVALGIAVWHFQSVADSQRYLIRNAYTHQSALLASIDRDIASTNDTVQSFVTKYETVTSIDRERHDQVESGTANFADLKALVDREQSANVDLSGTTTDLLTNMRGLTNSIEAGGTNGDTRSLRSNLEDITSNLESGESSCATATRMIGDNLAQIEHYGFYGLMSGNSSSDVQHSYDDCNKSFATVAGKMPSFHDSATRLASAYTTKLHSLGAAYAAVYGPLDIFVKVKALTGVKGTSPYTDLSDSQRAISSATPQNIQTDGSENVESAAPDKSTNNSDAPLNSTTVLPLLRTTSALSVSTRSNGHQADVSVVDTPAHGMADAGNFTTGRLVDGRWVGIVPLSSESSKDVVYTLLWVWANGQANFVGEIPAENDGFGHLTMTVKDGAIDLKWPVRTSGDKDCCPSEVREKLLTLDGARVRLLSDDTTPQ